MDQHYNNCKIVAEATGETRELVDKIVRSQFELLHDVMESATLENNPAIALQYLGTWQSNPYHLAKLKEKRDKKTSTET